MGISQRRGASLSANADGSADDVVPLISRTKHDLASGYGNLDISRVFQRMANQGWLLDYRINGTAFPRW
jgi:hypothetical protein